MARARKGEYVMRMPQSALDEISIQMQEQRELIESLRGSLADLLPLAESYLKSAPSHPDNAKLEDARALLIGATSQVPQTELDGGRFYTLGQEVVPAAAYDALIVASTASLEWFEREYRKGANFSAEVMVIIAALRAALRKEKQ